MSLPDFTSSQEKLAANTQEAWDATRQRGAEALAKTGQFVEANPLPAVLGALILGIIVGFLLRRSEPPAPERYVEKAIDDLRDYIRPLADWAARNAEQGGEAASEVAQSFAKKIKRGMKRFS